MSSLGFTLCKNPPPCSICIYIYIYIQMCVCVRACVCVYVNICTHMYVHIHVYVYKYLHTYIYITYTPINININQPININHPFINTYASILSYETSGVIPSRGTNKNLFCCVGLTAVQNRALIHFSKLLHISQYTCPSHFGAYNAAGQVKSRQGKWCPEARTQHSDSTKIPIPNKKLRKAVSAQKNRLRQGKADGGRRKKKRTRVGEVDH